jgi:hypothetical protein
LLAVIGGLSFKLALEARHAGVSPSLRFGR